MKRLKSAYRDEWSFRTVHSQLDALLLSEKRDTVQDEYQHNTVGLMEGNPLHLPDFWLAGIDIATNRMCIMYNRYIIYEAVNIRYVYRNRY